VPFEPSSEGLVAHSLAIGAQFRSLLAGRWVGEGGAGRELFGFSRHYQFWRVELSYPMQDARPEFVLDSEAKSPLAMDGTPTHPLPQPLESTDSDEDLMIAFSRGSADAFNELFSRYKQPLFGFFRRRLADPTYAEELSQETFLVVLRSSVRYQPRALFRTYLYAVGLKILRAHRRKAAFRGTFLYAAPAHQQPAAPNNTEEVTIVRHAIQQLRAIDREILLLREFEQLRYSEIADLLNLPVNTVRSRLFHARVSLRALLTAPIQKGPAVAAAKSEENT